MVVGRKSSVGRYKCNVDVSFSRAVNKAGLGMCIRDDEGCFVLAKIEWISAYLMLVGVTARFSLNLILIVFCVINYAYM